jgi:hypothetical protein
VLSPQRFVGDLLFRFECPGSREARSSNGWKTSTLISVKPNVTFVRVVFYGDASHLPSSALDAIKVV